MNELIVSRLLRMYENRFDPQCSFSDITDDQNMGSVIDKALNEPYPVACI